MADMSASDLEAPGIFDGLTAWFSSSVKPDRINIWRENDGDIADIGEAMLVFSEDSDAEDTKILYTSHAYLNDSLAVFHASYIDQCIDAGSTKKVVIGKYFLPPSAVYAKIKSRVKYCYDYGSEEENNDIHQKQQSNKTSSAKRQKKEFISSRENTEDYSEYVNIDSLSEVTGPLEDIEAGKNDCIVYRL